MSGLLPLFIIVVVFLLHGIVPITCANSYSCLDSYKRCPNGKMIKYPFYWEDAGNEYDCGYPGLSAKCSEGEKGRPILTLSNHSYYYQVTGVPHKVYTDIRLVDVNFEDQICPHPRHNFTLEGVVAYSVFLMSSWITFFYNCTNLPKDVAPNLPCVDNNNNASRSSFATSYYDIPKSFNWYGNCQESVIIPMQISSNMTNYTEGIKLGTLIRLQPNEECQKCEKSGGFRTYNRNTNTSGCACNGVLLDERCPKYSSTGKTNHIKLKLIFGLSAGTGGSLLILLTILLIVYRRCVKNGPTNEEVFLQSYGSHVLQRFKYSDIKRMTNSFKDILGQGGFGYVFKGTLPDGRMVAVKLLNKSKSDGEEFINKVATIGRTNHVNVVTLIGFCIEGTKRALVYEFMENGSLEKFIYKEKSLTAAYAPSLGWEQIYQIALGIARGLEYLHRGCNNRILHFDIKPHNILLDSKFVPKISDFGLAKLSQTRDSIVSMVGTRETSGYIAPEIYCRNLGVVSYKSDVYSYGMMLFEMIGGRKNIDTNVENISEIYFPEWIYNHLNKQIKAEALEDTEINVSKDILENEISKKMIIVALWCIQTHPVDQPSMKKVAEMLEETNDKLQMPPNPSHHHSSRLSPSSP